MMFANRKWRRRHYLDLGDIWPSLSDGSMSCQDGGKIIAERLAKIRVRDDDYADERDDLVDAFKHIDTLDEFDDAMERLYDWGDTLLDTTWPLKLCWISTSTPAKAATA